LVIAGSDDEQNNKKNRVAEFQQTFGNSNQDDDVGVGEGGKVDSECTICMNNRVNAVIYRCGHMVSIPIIYKIIRFEGFIKKKLTGFFSVCALPALKRHEREVGTVQFVDRQSSMSFGAIRLNF
jgi:hypothetical protein